MSEKIKDGGPAFPFPVMHGNNAPSGMTLRDYFAAKALASGDCPHNAFEHDERAAWAMDEADAMLRAREVQS